MSANSPRPRAADDFAAIRARMEELRREREQLAAEGEPDHARGGRRAAILPRPGANRPGIPLPMRRVWLR